MQSVYEKLGLEFDLLEKTINDNLRDAYDSIPELIINSELTITTFENVKIEAKDGYFELNDN